MTLDGTGSNAAANTKEQSQSEAKSRSGSDHRQVAESIGKDRQDEELYDLGSVTNANTTMMNTQHPSGPITGSFPIIRPAPSQQSTLQANFGFDNQFQSPRPSMPNQPFEGKAERYTRMEKESRIYH